MPGAADLAARALWKLEQPGYTFTIYPVHVRHRTEDAAYQAVFGQLLRDLNAEQG